MASINLGRVKPEINNNLTTTTTGAALDAAQGKVLDDKIKNVSTLVDIKNMTEKTTLADTDVFAIEDTGKKKVTLQSLYNWIMSKLGDTGWVYPTLTSYYRPQEGTQDHSLRVRRIGKHVYMVGNLSPTKTITGNSTGDDAYICTLAAQFRPVVSTNRIMNGSSRDIWALRIGATNGQVVMYRYRVGDSYKNATTDTMLNIEANWMVN